MLAQFLSYTAQFFVLSLENQVVGLFIVFLIFLLLYQFFRR